MCRQFDMTLDMLDLADGPVAFGIHIVRKPHSMSSFCSPKVGEASSDHVRHDPGLYLRTRWPGNGQIEISGWP